MCNILIKGVCISSKQAIGGLQINALSFQSFHKLADLSEIILSLAQVQGFTPDQLESARISKRETKGGFEKRIYNAFVEVPAKSPHTAYYRAQPDKYPEVVE